MEILIQLLSLLILTPSLLFAQRNEDFHLQQAHQSANSSTRHKNRAEKPAAFSLFAEALFSFDGAQKQPGIFILRAILSTIQLMMLFVFSR